MKSYIFILLFVFTTSLSWCFYNSESVIYEEKEDGVFSGRRENINNSLEFYEIHDYSFGIQQTWFISKEIPSNYSWRVYTVDKKNMDVPYYFSWFEPLLYEDKIYWIKILLSENFHYSHPKIYHVQDSQYDDQFIYISLLSNWEYFDDNYNTRYEITIINNNNKKRLKEYENFYWDSFIWKNNKYSFYFISPFVESDVIYPWGEYFGKNRLKQQLFLWFSFFNI